MKLYQIIIILLLLICTAFVTKEITIMFYKCPPCEKEVIDSGISLRDNFRTMFEKPSPWQGINQILSGIKKQVDAPMDDEY